MGTRFKRDEKHRRVTLTLSDSFVLTDVLGIIEIEAAGEAWHYAMLCDLRGLTKAPTKSDVERIVDRVQLIAVQRPRGPQAFVTADPTARELVLMYQRRIDPLVRVGLFETIEQAEEWLVMQAAQRCGSEARRSARP